MYSYKVEHHSHTEITREGDPNERWDGDDTSTSWYIEHSVSRTEKASDVVSCLELEPNKTYYLVYVIHSTGDSFSHSHGRYCDFLDIFSDKTEADKLVSIIEKHHNDYKNNKLKKQDHYSLTYLDEKNNKRTVSCSWNGYFESLDDCAVISVSLDNKYQNKRLNKKLKKLL